jgi:hypothetical protein
MGELIRMRRERRYTLLVNQLRGALMILRGLLINAMTESGHISSTHVYIGVRRSLPSNSAGHACVMGDVWCTTIASYLLLKMRKKSTQKVEQKAKDR